MAELLANAVVDRRRPPARSFSTWYGGRRVTLDGSVLERLFHRAGRHAAYNEGADRFRFDVIEALTAEVYDPSFHNLDDARDHFRSDDAVTEFLLRHWPPLTPEQALNDLLGSPALLRSAGRHTDLSGAELDLLARPRTPFRQVDRIRWSNADIPLLDELLALLGISLGDVDGDDRIRERDEADEFELAAQAEAGRVADDLEELDDVDDEGGEGEDELADSLDALLGTDGEPGLDPMFDTSVLDERYEVDGAQAPAPPPARAWTSHPWWAS
jgi:hypothetical protein